MHKQSRKILLIDLDDQRRFTRVQLLERAGYEVQLRADYVEAERLDQEASFDLVIIALHQSDLQKAAAYSERVRAKNPTLPLLLVTDGAVFVPKGILSAWRPKRRFSCCPGRNRIHARWERAYSGIES